MPDRPAHNSGVKGLGSDGRPIAQTHVNALALRVLEVLASKKGESTTSFRKSRIEELCEAVVEADESRMHDALARMISCGVTTEQIFEHYVPRAAEMLGQAWVDDELPFTKVSIGAARLQQIVRMFDARYTLNTRRGHPTRSAMLIVPDFEQHTLGALIAASRMRRRGIGVYLAVDKSVGSLLDSIRTHDFALVGISVSSERSAALTGALVRTLRGELSPGCPIIVGGAVVNLDIDVQAETCADIVSTDMDYVLSLLAAVDAESRVEAAR